LEFLSTHLLSSSSSSTNDNGHEQKSKKTTRAETSFLDLGTGNGELLFGLREEGWGGRMLGVDYSERSVEFARRINEARQEEYRERAEYREEQDEQDEEVDDDDDDEPNPSREPVEFEQLDILSPPPPASAVLSGAQSRGWDVVLDKGTFDAISLSSATDGRGRRINEGYRASALRLVREGGLFLITSCNWTEDELVQWFAGKTPADDDEEEEGLQGWTFEVVDRLKYRVFTFGGVKGQTISSMCFRKVAR
jgi:EEF1A lysine methyltransferase 2